MSKDQYRFEVQWLSPKTLTPYANNPKIHTVEQIDKIAGQISKFGFDQPIVVDKNYVIIKGHGRREASIRLLLDKVPVIVREDLDEYEAMAERLGDNEVAKSEYNTELLRFELGTLQRQDFDLKATGFELKKIEDLLNVDDLVETPSREKTSSEKTSNEVAQNSEDVGSDSLGQGGEDGENSNEEPDQGSPDATQFIVTIHLDNEEEMKGVYEEMVQRGFTCKLVT